jgi:hypothetical protein
VELPVMELPIEIILNKEQKLLKKFLKKGQYSRILNPILQMMVPKGLLYMMMEQDMKRAVRLGVKKQKTLL